MPPKKKGKGKGKKGPMLIDGVDTSSMTRDQLEAFALRLKAEMDREREERNYFQMERDKIRTYWEISRGQAEELRTEIRQKDHEVEMAQELADTDTKHIMQQMKHLQYENHTKIGEIRAETLTQLQLAQEDHLLQEQELLRDKRELRRQLHEKDETMELQMQQLEMKQAEELHLNNVKFEKEAKDLEMLHQLKTQKMKDDLELIYKMQMFEVEERKNLHIQRLTESHDNAFNEMKNYYNDITLNNLGLISSLKEQMEVLRKNAERADRMAGDMLAENRKLKEPLEAAQVELVDLRRKLEHFDRDRSQLARLKARNNQIEKELTALNWETEALLLRNDTLARERSNMKGKFEDVFTELQQKTGLKNVLLERKIEILRQKVEDGERRELFLKESINVCNTDVQVMQATLEKKLEEMLADKNKMIKDLQFDVARVCKAHDDLLLTYEAKLEQFGIPKEELGFEPMRFTTNLKYLCGPAGLVAKNK